MYEYVCDPFNAANAFNASLTRKERLLQIDQSKNT